MSLKYKNIKTLKQTTHFRDKKAFTLVELLVAIAIFIIIITIVSDIHISTVGSQREAFGLQDVMDNSRFSFENIARAVRQSNVVSATSNSLEVNHPTKGLITYTLSGGRIMENNAPLTAANIIIEKLTFITDGLAGNDSEQPRVTVIIKARSKNQKPTEVSLITIQTTITPRKLQFQ